MSESIAISSGWTRAPLGALGTFTNGINKGADDFGFGVPFVNLLDVFGKTLIDDYPQGLVNATTTEIERYSLRAGDVIFIRSSVKPSGVGLTALVERGIENTVYSGFLIRFRPAGDHFAAPFLQYCFYNEEFRRKLISRSTVSANTNINQVALKQLELSLPPPSQQRRIAEILTTVDEAMEQTEALVGKLEQMKAGLMHDLFTRGVTPDGHLRPTRQEAPHLYHQTPLGWLPKAWSPGLLSDYLDPSNGIKPGPFGSSLTKDIYTSSGYRIYGQEQVIAGSLEVGDYHISAAKFAEMRMFEVLEGDILLSLVGTVGCVLVVEPPFEPGIINPRLMRLRPLPGRTAPQFIRHLLLTADIRRQIDSLAGGGTMPVINGKVIRRLRAPLIESQEQERIVQRIASVESKIESSTTYLAKLRQQKQGLMQDLLTGRVRVGATQALADPILK